MQRPAPLDFIATVRESFKAASFVYTNGGCYQFYKILKHLYPEAEPWMDKYYHVLTEIQGEFYDIDGLASSEPLTYMNETLKAKAEKWVTDTVTVDKF